MTRRARVKAVTGGVLVMLGIVFATLPKRWIEDTLGFEPDGGSGALELAIPLVAISAGVVLIASALTTRAARRRATPAQHPVP